MKNKTCGECKIARPSGLKGWMYCPRKHDTVLSEAGQCKTPYTTNGDKIRQMSDEELAKVIECPHFEGVCIHRYSEYPCKCCKRDWLKQEVKDE